MYFAIFDPYDERYDSFLYEYNKHHKENILEYDNDDNNCLICWDNNVIQKPTRIHMINNVISNCNCNILVHQSCLYEWIKKTHSCPICRETMLLKIFQIKILREYLGFLIFNKFINYVRLIMFVNLSIVFFYNIMLVYYLLINYKDDENYI